MLWELVEAQTQGLERVVRLPDGAIPFAATAFDKHGQLRYGGAIYALVPRAPEYDNIAPEDGCSKGIPHLPCTQGNLTECVACFRCGKSLS